MKKNKKKKVAVKPAAKRAPAVLRCSRTAFVNAMKAKRPGTMVGFADSIVDCPLAKFVSERNKAQVLVTDKRFITAGRPDYVEHPLPAWAHDLVTGLMILKPGSRITARHVLDAMGIA